MFLPYFAALTTFGDHWRSPSRIIPALAASFPFGSERAALLAPLVTLAAVKWAPAAPVVPIWAGAIALMLLAEIAKRDHRGRDREAELELEAARAGRFERDNRSAGRRKAAATRTAQNQPGPKA